MADNVTNMAFVRMSITIPKETKEKVEQLSKEQMRSVSNMIAYLIESYSK